MPTLRTIPIYLAFIFGFSLFSTMQASKNQTLRQKTNMKKSNYFNGIEPFNIDFLLHQKATKLCGENIHNSFFIFFGMRQKMRHETIQNFNFKTILNYSNQLVQIAAAIKNDSGEFTLMPRTFISNIMTFQKNGIASTITPIPLNEKGKEVIGDSIIPSVVSAILYAHNNHDETKICYAYVPRKGKETIRSLMNLGFKKCTSQNTPENYLSLILSMRDQNEIKRTQQRILEEN